MFKEITVLEQFLIDPVREYSVREYAKIIKKSPATTSKWLMELANKGYLESREFRNHLLFRAKKDEMCFIELKKYYNIKKIRDSGLIKFLEKEYNFPAIILFGSYAKAENNIESDVDIVVISERSDIVKLKNYEKILNAEIQLFVVKKLSDLGNKHLMNNVVNGVVLSGNIEVF